MKTKDKGDEWGLMPKLILVLTGVAALVSLWYTVVSFIGVVVTASH